MVEVVVVGLFEQNPWLLIPIIILTGEVWQALKAVIKTAVRQRHAGIAPAPRPPSSP
jgi:hypothetical protein